VRPQRDGTVEVTHEQQRHALERFEIEPGRIRCEWDGVSRSVAALMHGDTLHLAWQGATFVFDEADPVPDGASAVDARRAHAPVAGVIAKVAVGPGETVVAGQPLVCVEAMKMEMWVIAPAAARVTLLSVRAGDIVAAGALVVEFEPAAAD
jgi:geranyl-CoA carboxylase alpha subunit